MSAKIIW